MIELYHHPLSPASQKVRIVLAEKGIEYVSKVVNLPAKENLAEWYLKLNPLGVLPTLVVDGEAVCESSIICEFLDERVPQPSLVPGEPLANARMRGWMKHVDERLHYATGALMWTLVMRPGMLAKPPHERSALLDRIPDRERQKRHRRWIEHGIDSEDFPDAVEMFRQTIADLDDELASGPWAVGQRFTLADVALLPYFQVIDQFGWNGFLADAPRVVAWFDQAKHRTGFKAVRDHYDPMQLRHLHEAGAAQWPKIAARLTANGPSIAGGAANDGLPRCNS
jgi:glutathione S-transferase